MSSSEMDKSSKEGKETKESKISASQEQNSATSGMVTAEWAAFQGYSPMPPHGFLASSPQLHPYMWGVQACFWIPTGLIFSFGALHTLDYSLSLRRKTQKLAKHLVICLTPPHPYVAMYPPGGIYAHPTIPPGSYHFSPFAMPSPNGITEASPNTPGNVELDGKSSEGKEKLPIKVSKGSLASLNMITGKDTEPGKTSGASADGVHSKSGESASEGSSEGSDANSLDDSQMKSGGLQDSAETSQNGNAGHGSQNGGPNTHNSMVNQTLSIMPVAAARAVGGVPHTTNLNIGIDYWGAATPSTIPAMHGKVPSLVAGGMVTTGSRENVQSQIWIQDERELKRQRRKQSNRESARRSRLRKQAECDELAQRAAALNEENTSLRAEVARIRSEYEQLCAQNASLKEKLGESSSQDDPRCNRDSGQADNDGNEF